MTSAERPMVSVIIPSYNTGQTVERAIASVVVAAARLSFEVVVVDDGSQDDSLTVLRQLAARWPQVKLFTHPGGGNRGIAATRNLAMANACGTYLAFLDADDELLPNRFDVCIDMLNADPAIDAVVEPYELVHVSGARSAAMRDGDTAAAVEDIDPVERFRAALMRQQMPHTTSITIRSSAMQAVGGFPTHIFFNLEKPVWLKLYSRCAIRSGAKVPVARYYLHDSSACARNEHKASFRFEELAALIDVSRWMRRNGSRSDFRQWIRTRIRGKYLHYCGYVHELEHGLLQDCFGAALRVAVTYPGLMLDPTFVKATARMLAIASVSRTRRAVKAR